MNMMGHTTLWKRSGVGDGFVILVIQKILYTLTKARHDLADTVPLACVLDLSRTVFDISCSNSILLPAQESWGFGILGFLGVLIGMA